MFRREESAGALQVRVLDEKERIGHWRVFIRIVFEFSVGLKFSPVIVRSVLPRMLIVEGVIDVIFVPISSAVRPLKLPVLLWLIIMLWKP